MVGGRYDGYIMILCLFMGAAVMLTASRLGDSGGLYLGIVIFAFGILGGLITAIARRGT